MVKRTLRHSMLILTLVCSGVLGGASSSTAEDRTAVVRVLNVKEAEYRASTIMRWARTGDKRLRVLLGVEEASRLRSLRGGFISKAPTCEGRSDYGYSCLIGFVSENRSFLAIRFAPTGDLAKFAVVIRQETAS